MPKKIYYGDHEDDGSGRCGYCYEDWPCTYRANGGRGVSGIQAWAEEVRQKEYDRKQAERERAAEVINKQFREMGLDLKFPIYSQTMTIKLEDLTKIFQYFTEAINAATNDRGTSNND